MKKYRFHLLGLSHLPQARRYSSCAFTQKNLKLAKMLTQLGHTVFFYGSEGSDVAEYCRSKNLIFIQTHTLKDIRTDYGEGDNRFELGYDHEKQLFKNDFNDDLKKASTIKFQSKVISEINSRKREDDFLLITQGQYQKPIGDAVNLELTIEPGVGYRGSYTKFKAFESSYIQNFTYGSRNPFKSINGNHYDRVIPNFFDEEDFEVGKRRRSYYLYIGRLIGRKGVMTAVKTTEAIGAKLILAGQQDKEIDVKTLPKHCKFVGTVDVEERKKLMMGAIATFVPSEYLEPFAGVHVESMLCGTPPITTNFGVFPETIPDTYNWLVGYRCNTLKDFVEAAEDAKINGKRNRHWIRHHGERFAMRNVKDEYQRWFDDLYQWYLSATIEGVKGWHHL